MIVGVLVYYGVQLNPSEAQAKDFPGKRRRDRRPRRRWPSARHLGRRDEAVRRARRERRQPGGDRRQAAARRPASPAPSRRRTGSRARTASSRPSRRPTERRRQVRSTIKRVRAELEGHGRHARRRRGRGSRLRRGRLLELPVRARLRRATDVHPARARVPLARAAAEGRDPQPGLAAGGLRDHRLHLPAGPRLGGDLGRARHAVDHPLDPADDLRVPVRALDGLRGLHALAHARGLRRDRRHESCDLARPGAHGEAGDERGARPDVRLLRALVRARASTSSSSGSGWRPGSSSTPR